MKKAYIFLLAVAAFAASLSALAAGSTRGTESLSSPLRTVCGWQQGVPAAHNTASPARLAAAKAPSLANLRINGFLMYDDDRNQDLLGFYEYSATAPIARRALCHVPRQSVGGDAVVYDGKLYTYHLEQAYGYVSSAFYTEIDVATGQATKSANVSYDLGPAYEHYATSAAVNPADGKAYCSGFTFNATDLTLTPTLKTWDLEGQFKTAVGTMEASLAVMSFDNEGNLFGITACSSRGSDDGGYLVSVDTTTGKLTVIGDTGIRPWFDQSGVISPYDNVLYWFANEPLEGDANAAKAMLYTVDLGTANTTAAGELPNGDEVVAAWIPVQTVADGAPGTPTGLSAAFTNASFKGEISFTLPTCTYSGETLSGELDWAVRTGDKTLAEGKANAGQKVSAEAEVPASGEYTFEIFASNAEGAGISSRLTTYIGYGVPAAAADVNFAMENNTNIVTWTHSEGLVGEGFLEGEHPSYRIVRQPGDVLLQEAWTDNRFTEPAIGGALQSTFYEIIPVNGDVTGEAARSNALVTGSTLSLPYSEDFTEASSFDLYTAIDVNEDNSTWYYSLKSVKIRQASSDRQDDWLILPPVHLEKGLSYEFKFNAYATQVSNVNILDVAMGKSPEDMSVALLGDIEIADTKSTAMKEVTVNIKPAETATYNIGIRIKSDSRQGTFTVDDISISAGTSTAIPAAPEFTVTAGAKGALNAELSFAIPALTAGGDELVNRPTHFEIERDGNALATVETAEGKTGYSYTDNAIEAAGTYIYAIRAINADGKGETSEQTVFVGCDTPLAPAGFKATDNFDGTVNLTWDEPSATGANGGYVDTDRLTYTVTSPDGKVAADITGTFAVADIATTGTQAEVRYRLGVRYAGEPASADRTVDSNTLIAGQSYTMPFAESFPIVEEMTAPTTAIWTKEVIEGKSSSVTLSMRADADHTADGGAGLHFTAYAADVVARWCSPVLDLSASTAPEVTMWVKTPDNKASFELQICKEYGAWETIATLNDAADWTEVKVDLADHRSKHVRLGMLIRSKNNFNYTYVDDIAVLDTAPTGIENVTVSDCTIEEIYTLRGIRVADMTAPGIYIVRKGTEARKVIIR